MLTMRVHLQVPSMHEVEHALDGNLCRCTGYRPILQAFRSFSSEDPAAKEFVQKACDSVFPEELKVAEAASVTLKGDIDRPPRALVLPCFVTPVVALSGSKAVWHRPATLSALLQLKAAHPDMKIIVGNSEVAIERLFRNAQYPVLVTPSHVPELNLIQMSDRPDGRRGLEIGSAATLTVTMEALKEAMATEGEAASRTFVGLYDQMEWFASTPIRNAASIGGNIVTASPISDLNPLFMAAGSILKLMKSSGEQREVPIREFFTGYRRTLMGDDEILLSVWVPCTQELEFFMNYKQCRRRDDDIAIVNAGMRVILTPSPEGAMVVSEASLAFGGMSATSVSAVRTEAMMKGRLWDQDLLKDALAMLSEGGGGQPVAAGAEKPDLPLPLNAPGGMAQYRSSLALSFFFKFFLHVSQATGTEASPRDLSAFSHQGHGFDRPAAQGLQHFDYPDPTKVEGATVGKPFKHCAGDLHVSGEAKYIDDTSMPAGTLYGYFVVSDIPSGKILSVDTSLALSEPGVVSYVDGKDVEAIGGSLRMSPAKESDELIFAGEEVTSCGAVIGMIVAESKAAAKQGALKVQVEYEKTDAILSIEDAIAKQSFFTPPFATSPSAHLEGKVLKKGDVETALKEEGLQVTTGEFRIGGQEHFYLETNATLAIPGEDGTMDVLCSTQNPTKTQFEVAKAIGVSANRVTCKCKRMGGGFGGKETRTVFISCAVAVAASRLQKPVHVFLPRDVDMAISGGRHPYLCKYTVGHDKQGVIKALDVELFSNGGYSTDLSWPSLERAMFHCENAYSVPNLRVRGRVCKTNLPSNTAFRGFGGPQGMMVAENIIEQVAGACDLDAHDVRLKNLYQDGDITHYNMLVDNNHLQACIDQVSGDRSLFMERRASVEAFNATNKWRKRGLSLIPTKFGMSFTATFMNQASALVHVYADGTVLVTHGGTEMGQGLHTKMVQIAAQELDVAFDQVHVEETNTSKCANTMPTAASVSADMNGMAVKMACEDICARLAPIRAKMPAGTTFKQVVFSAHMQRVNLSAHAFYATPDIYMNWPEGQGGEGKPFKYFAYGAAMSEVEVDTLTGDFHVLRADVVHDVGRSLNPAIDIGQVEGAFVQGMGLFTMEECIWNGEDSRAPGQWFTRGPSTYKIPSFNDIPLDFRVGLLAGSDNEGVVHSSKGVGEPPLFLGSSVFFAIRDAIKAARAEHGEHGSFHLDSPASCERIRMACSDDITRHFAPSDFVPSGSW